MKRVVQKALAIALAGALVFGSAKVPAIASEVSSPTTTTRQPVAQKAVTASKTSSGLTPTVNTAKSGAATFVDTGKTKKKTITVNSTVKVDGVKYTITTIGAKAFENATKAETIVIPKTVTKINSKGFSKLAKTVKTIQFNTTKAPTVSKTAFKGTSTKKMTITVSKKMSAKELKKFKKALKAAGYKGKVKQKK
jgi:Sec-independent protein translocase protein TatA